MSFQITQDGTPILFKQSQQIKKFAMDFTTLYRGKKSVKERTDWGELLDSIYQALPTNQAVGSEDQTKTLSKNQLWVKVCAELDIPRSTADGYRSEFIASSKYPESVREAAASSGLNLAKDYVVKAYEKLVAGGQTKSPNELEAAGIVTKLEEVTDPNPPARPTRPSLKEKITAMFEDIFELAADEEVEPLLVQQCMEVAATKKLTVGQREVWQTVVLQMARDEGSRLQDHLIEGNDRAVGA